MRNGVKITRIFFLLVFFALSGCEKQEDFHVENLNHNVIMILGHAGMGEFYTYPNNSWESIEPALGIGADGVEIDIQMTRDSVLILFHDETLDLRTKCGGYTSPYDYNWSEIKECNYNTLFDYVPIYTLEEIFEKIPELTDYYFSFDVKLNTDHFYDEAYRLKFLKAIQRVCEKHEISKNVFLEGDLDLQLKAKELGLKTKGILIGSTVEKAIENDIFGVGYSLDVTKEEVNHAHNHGKYVMMWGARTDAANKQAIELNPDFLQTDKPIPILMLFERFNFDY
jgi:glycerophosphoryl diester phosphodiesterase